MNKYIIPAIIIAVSIIIIIICSYFIFNNGVNELVIILAISIATLIIGIISMIYTYKTE